MDSVGLILQEQSISLYTFLKPHICLESVCACKRVMVCVWGVRVWVCQYIGVYEG